MESIISETYRLEKVLYPNRMDEIGVLRVRAWINEPGADPIFFSRRAWIEPLDQTAFHWIITRNNVIVAAARMNIHETIATAPYSWLLPKEERFRFENQKIASFSRMVIDPQFRGNGFAEQLDRARIRMAEKKSVDVIVASTQLNFRIRALTKLGFSTACELHNAPERPDWPLYFMQYDLKKQLADVPTGLNL
ncbi:GNAT family N-acetyltransferase [Larkinella rosea]|uniref:GNAT family N-acetyltransferase n=1 Tax=Larkinella rosea TaxID=2025312 RepID=A0A3P1C3I1_9BACT|nr:GNAT family N-acetyltransferase [Larkinella rosea]RRB07576.1 GNAT family N-acetyltransferase [Larkinella rosea]